jgi:hypothetical protein
LYRQEPRPPQRCPQVANDEKCTNASFIVASAFGAAVLMSSAVFAQVPADPSNPNENLPDADDVVSLAGVAALK